MTHQKPSTRLRRRPLVRFLEHDPPRDGQPGHALVELVFLRSNTPPIRVKAEVRSDRRGRAVRIAEEGVAEWRGSMLAAAIWWSAGEGPADLWLTWGAVPPDAPAGYAEVSDIGLLAGNRSAQRAVQALLGTERLGGPPPGVSGLTVERLVEEAIGLREQPAGTWPTAARVAEALGVSDRRVGQVARPVGGWAGIRQMAAERLAED